MSRIKNISVLGGRNGIAKKTKGVSVGLYALPTEKVGGADHWPHGR